MPARTSVRAGTAIGELRPGDRTGQGPPNILFILADDLGWSDTTINGTTSFYRTPHIQRLADRGITLSDAYTASPVCTPTRASIMTGLYPARFGLTQARGHQDWVALEATIEKSAPPNRTALEVVTANRLPTEVTLPAPNPGYLGGILRP